VKHRALATICALVMILAACGDDATDNTAASSTTAATAPTETTVPEVGLIDTFDGTTKVATLFPSGVSTLDLGEAGVGHFIASDFVAATAYLAEYPSQYTLADGEMTLVFRQGAIAPKVVAVTFWKPSDYSRYAQVTLNLTTNTVYIGWYDAAVGNGEVPFTLAPDRYDPAGFNTFVIDLHGGTIAVTLNGQFVGESTVTLAEFDGELVWGMTPEAIGSELIVDEFTAVPAG
jgi:hypothetical protein